MTSDNKKSEQEKVNIEFKMKELDYMIAACMFYRDHIDNNIKNFRHLEQLRDEMDKSTKDYWQLITKLMTFRDK